MLGLLNTHARVYTCCRYEEDIQLAKDAHCNAFRLSIEWARVEPQRGVIDQQAVGR